MLPSRVAFSPLLIGIAVVTAIKPFAPPVISPFSPLLIGIAVVTVANHTQNAKAVIFQSPFNRDSSCNLDMGRRICSGGCIFQSPFNRDSSCNHIYPHRTRIEGLFQSPFNRDSSCNLAYRYHPLLLSRITDLSVPF